MKRPLIGMLVGLTAATPSPAECDKSSELLRRYVTLEAASQAACLGHTLSTYSDLGYGSVVRIAKEMDIQLCHLEIIMTVSVIKNEMESKGTDFCKWATEVRDGGYGSVAKWPE